MQGRLEGVDFVRTVNAFDFVLAVSAWQGLVEGALISHIIYWAVIMLDFFQTGVTSARWPKWFSETSLIITVTGQMHGCMSIIPLDLYQQIPCSLLHVCVVVLRTGQTE